MASQTLERHIVDVVRAAGMSDAPIQAWPLMRRIGQLPPEIQELAVNQISSLLDTFETLSAHFAASTCSDDCQQPRIAHLTWDPTVN